MFAKYQPLVPPICETALDPGRARRVREISRRLAVELLEFFARGHGVNEVERGGHAGERGVERGAIPQVGGHHLGAGRHAAGEMFGMARQASHAASSRFEPPNQPSADVAGGAGDENEGHALH